MLENSFISIVSKVNKGDMEEEKMFHIIENVVNTTVEEIYEKGKISFNEEDMKDFRKMLALMFNVAVIGRPKDIELQASLYALIMSIEEVE